MLKDRRTALSQRWEISNGVGENQQYYPAAKPGRSNKHESIDVQHFRTNMEDTTFDDHSKLVHHISVILTCTNHPVSIGF